jgi:hypothetical protein
LESDASVKVNFTVVINSCGLMGAGLEGSLSLSLQEWKTLLTTITEKIMRVDFKNVIHVIFCFEVDK